MATACDNDSDGHKQPYAKVLVDLDFRDSHAVLESTPLLASSSSAPAKDSYTFPEVHASPESQSKPSPWRKISIILVLCAAQPFAFELIFPFINQMILEVGIVDDPERVGFYSGVIESIFSFMSFLFVIPCSYISDIYGRKPVILLSIAIMAVAMSAFGFSRSYWFMIVTRSIGGVVGGCWAAMKVMLGELTDRSTQARAFALFNIAFRIGQILGQPVGGLLSHPERNFPFLDMPLWRAYPYAFPCVFSSSIVLFTVFVGCFVLTETKPSKKMRKVRIQACDSALANDDMMFAKLRRSPWLTALTPNVIAVLCSLATMVLCSEMVFALYPLFAFTPIVYGGLGLSEAAIGAHMAIRSFISILIMLLYAPVQERLGALRVYQWTTSTWPLAVLCVPVLNVLARAGVSELIMDVALSVFFVIWGIANLSWPAQAIVVNDAVPSADSLAAVNSVSTMVIVLTEAVAPAAATALFALSKSSHMLNGNLVWVVLFAISYGSAHHCWTLEESSHDWRKDYEDELAAAAANGTN